MGPLTYSESQLETEFTNKEREDVDFNLEEIVGLTTVTPSSAYWLIVNIPVNHSLLSSQRPTVSQISASQHGGSIFPKKPALEK